jgi:hypothetical protein
MTALSPHLVVAAALALVGAASTLAQTEDSFAGLPHHQLTRTDEAPVIDGVLDEAVWEQAVPIDDFRQTEPVEGGEPSERTEVRLLFDRDFLYVGFRCYDSEPDKIVARVMKRDAGLGPDDFIAIVVDPIFDRRNGYYFEMSATGARGDGLVENNNRLRKDWDGIWYGKATIDDQGWVAEMSIPYKTISFNPSTTRWGFNASRRIRRHNESIRWASPSRDKNFNSMADAGIIEGIEDIEQGIGLDVKPYGLARANRDHDRDESQLDLDAGFDAFYKLTPSLTLALTVNTDFAETEVDDRQVNLTRFPLFFPEKRDFFLQDAGIFNFGGINRNPLPFFSRRIGLDTNGQPLDILAGAKLTGRVDDLNIGGLAVQMKDDETFGDKTYLVGRVSANVLEQSTVGAIFTHGDASMQDESWLGGVDFNYRDNIFDGTRVLQGNAFYQHSDTPGEDDGQTAWGARIEYPNDRVNWRVGFTEIGANFNAGLGFVPRRAIREYFNNWRYRWRPEDSWIRSIDSGVDLFLITNLSDEVESRNLDFEIVEFETQAGDRFGANFSRRREVLDDPFEISDGVIIPVGDYKFDRYEFFLNTSSGRPVDVRLSYEGGQFYTGNRDEYEIDVDWRVSNHLFLGAEFELNDVDLPQGKFITRLIRGRVDFFFTPDVSWSNFIQFDNVSDTVGVNSRFRWIIEPGSELFVVLNQSIDRMGSSYRVTDTEVTTKLTWTFRF